MKENHRSKSKAKDVDDNRSYKEILSDYYAKFSKAGIIAKLIIVVSTVILTCCYIPVFVIRITLLVLSRLTGLILFLLNLLIARLLPKENASRLGVLMIVGGILLYACRGILSPDSIGIKSLLKVVSWICAGIGILFYKRGRRLRALKGSVSIKNYSDINNFNNPVLYLRAFKDDDTSGSSTIGGTFWLFYGILSFVSVLTEEEQLAKSFADFGPFLTIGRPDEKLPEVGAIRIYVEDYDWQDVVVDLMQKARIVAIRISDSEGLFWEIEQAVLRIAPENLIFIVASKKKDYDAFKEKTRRLFPSELPEFKGWRKSQGTLRGYIYFKKDWTPQYVKIKNDYLRLAVTEPLVPLIKSALRPVYEQIGINWVRPPPKWYNILGLILAAIVFAATIARFVMKLLSTQSV